jgi:hypothetical protein
LLLQYSRSGQAILTLSIYHALRKGGSFDLRRTKLFLSVLLQLRHESGAIFGLLLPLLCSYLPVALQRGVQLSLELFCYLFVHYSLHHLGLPPQSRTDVYFGVIRTPDVTTNNGPMSTSIISAAIASVVCGASGLATSHLLGS